MGSSGCAFASRSGHPMPRNPYELRERARRASAILDVLAGPMTSWDIAAKLGRDEHTVLPILLGMVQRRELVRLKAKPGEAPRFRLPRQAA